MVQGKSQDLETGCPKFSIYVNFSGVLFFKGDHNTLLDYNYKHVFTCL